MRIALAASLLSLSACAGPPIVTASQISCASLVPEAWRQGVEGAELPQGDTVADWVAFSDAQTGRLDQANDRTKSAIEIVSKCEERDAQSIKRATRRKFLGLF